MDTGDSFAYVKFVSDATGNAPGFSLTFTASVEGWWPLSKSVLKTVLKTYCQMDFLETNEATGLKSNLVVVIVCKGVGSVFA